MKNIYTYLTFTVLMATQTFAALNEAEVDAPGGAPSSAVAPRQYLASDHAELEGLEEGIKMYRADLRQLEEKKEGATARYEDYRVKEYAPVSVTGDFDAKAVFEDHCKDRVMIQVDTGIDQIVEEYRKALVCHHELEGAIDRADPLLRIMISGRVEFVLQRGGAGEMTQNLLDAGDHDRALYKMHEMRDAANKSMDLIEEKNRLVNECRALRLFLEKEGMGSN